MKSISDSNINSKLDKYFPAILLIISVLNEFDFNNLGLKYFSFNFSYILIFYFSLKRNEGIGYILIFTAGLFNDVVTGIPMGLSSLIYLLLSGAAVYLRNITLRPNLIKDWFFFLITILILNALTFIILTLFFDYDIEYLNQFVNILFTFVLYLFFSQIFYLIEKILLGTFNVR
jgi:rod shape-determining protein MreD